MLLNHRHLFLVLLLCLVLPFLPQAPAWAEGITAIAEFDYSSTRITTENSSGFVVDNTKVNTFLHRYFLNLDKTLYPNLKFTASGTFDQTISDSRTNDVTNKTTATVENGVLQLLQSTRFITSGVGYTIRQEKTDTSNQPSLTELRETYSANLGLRPAGLPPVETLFLRTHTYDKERQSQDIISDFLSVTSKYDPIKDLELTGQVSLNDQKDRLTGLDSRTVNYQGRATYARKFGERVSAYTTYTFTRQDTRISGGGTGEVLFQVFPGEAGWDFTDTPPVQVQLTFTGQANPLIDGILVASAGIDLGPLPFGSTDTAKQWNIGVDFPIDSEVNTILLWVDRPLPNSVAALFSWDIYTSTDNVTWTFFQTVPSAPFGTFDNRFEISFRNVTTRFIKVVTRRLSPTVVVPPGVDIKNIFVTELQTFLKRPAQEVKGETTQTTHVFDLDVKWKILDRPNIIYDMYYWSVISQPGGTRYILTNSVNLTHRLSRIFSGSLRLAREDGHEPEPVGRRSANIYSASLFAVPLPTLLHSLVVSGRFEETEQGSNNTNSVFFNNMAELYKGLNFFLGGGLSVANNADGAKTVSTIINSGVTAIPHPALTLNVNFSQTDGETTGGERAASSNVTRLGNFNITYTPFSTIYIFTSFGIASQTGRETTTLQNYGVTWSPFRDGDLQFNFFYNESLNSEGTKERTLGPSLIWTLRRNTTLNVSYSIATSTSPAEKTETKVFAVNLRVGLL
ncbi:conserved exported hypothetical protein [Candidatus Sulfobium mesophilum]|uniref:F5/8 type C domain-containing protein n=1 Tax=Candidatus Sulfobium mesophilum TaxID=2016548 RepID=A0A2U3QGL2_9BACT|nr:conserved exported hypothetical protein [Candidatus Sulfobium mesophilum]